MARESVARIVPAALYIALEGATDFFFGRPLDENPYARGEVEAWEAWRFGWLEASWFNESRGDVERRRWRTAA